MNTEMYVQKRDGSREPVSFDKVLERIRKAADGLSVAYTRLAQLVLAEIHDGVHTAELDELAARLAVSFTTTHPDWGTLAARIIVSNCVKNAPATFSEAMAALAALQDSNGRPTPAIAVDVAAFIAENAAVLNAMVDPSRDYLLDYFGFKTLEKAYLLRDRSKHILETPQYMWLRVAVGIWGCSHAGADLTTQQRLDRVQETYDLMSLKAATHATPTLFNAGTPRPQLSSCFLVAMKDDSINGIFDTLKDCAQISKYAGGIGLHVHNIRAQGTPIAGTQGTSNGLVPMLRVFNNTARYVDQGGGKRNGSFAIYLEPWHADVQSFLKMKSNTGAEEERARDLFYALWIPDLFMKRVESGGDWSLFCPHEAPGLADAVGEDFERLYTQYEAEGRARRVIPAQKLWSEILVSQIETGTPYLLYKDAANVKSNQKNLGVIKSSNLCVAPETLILTDKGHLPIATLVNQKVNVWNGERWSETTVRQTGEGQSLLKVSLSNGAVIECTPYHKFILNSKRTTVHGKRSKAYDSLKDAVRVDAKDLTVGATLARWEAPVVQGDVACDFKEPYTHGFFCGDGNEFRGDYKRIILCGDKKKLIPYLALNTIGSEQKNGTIQAMIPKDLQPKFAVPMNASIACRVAWLAGLLDADGGVHRSNKNTDVIDLANTNYEFLDQIRLMLATLGVHAKVIKQKEAREETFPGGKTYSCKPLYHIPLGAESIYQLVQLGMKCHRLTFRHPKPSVLCQQFVKVVSVADEGRTDDTYCFTEEENHVGVFNGVATGQCTEIMEYSSPEETSVCNLASLALPHFLEKGRDDRLHFNYDKLRAVVAVLVRNLNRVIDINYYPTPETKRSNLRHRPVGLGVQGLADVFAQLGLAWETPEAIALNQEIFENIYFAAVYESCLLAARDGPYETFRGSPASQGLLQPELWGKMEAEFLSAGYLDWTTLRQRVVRDGLRNSLLLAPMPTASTSQILGYNECIEPFTTNIYVRRTLAGEFTVVNKYLVADLMAVGLWSPELKERIVAANGSVQALPELPEDIKARYKTVWEIKQKTLIDMAADRGAFICQSQSLNLFVADPTIAKLSSMHFYAWKRGLKTGIYYLRTKSAVQAIKFTVDPALVAAQKASAAAKDPAECLLCSS
jgi:ribonucleoside-diphosphate reductase alpha chain